MRWILVLVPAIAFAQSPAPSAASDRPSSPDTSTTTEESSGAEQTPAQTPASSTDASAAESNVSEPTPEQQAAPDKAKGFSTYGYRKVEKDGQTMYCRSEAEIGTRFKKTRCYTTEEMQEMAQGARDQLLKQQRR